MQKSTRPGLGLLLAALFLAALCPSVSAETRIDLSELQGVYAPNMPFTGDIRIKFDNPLPTDAVLKAYINDVLKPPSVGVQPFTRGISYQYRQYSFTYAISASGENRWSEYPSRSFYYRFRATGTCGNQECGSSGTCDCAGLCTPFAPSYSCTWSFDTPPAEDKHSSVSSNEGLKEITDASEYIIPPASSNQDTRWYQLITSADVQTTMRNYCGGWARAALENGESVPPAGRKFRIEPYDEASLTLDRDKFPEGDCTKPYICGGIYKNTTRLTSTSQFALNGSLGEITIKSYDPKAVYTITYLPPNGPLLCAYTSYKISNSTMWTASSVPQSGSASYGSPFSKSYTESQLPMRFNDTNRLTSLVKPEDCPDYVSECNQTVKSYSASKASDTTPGGTIQVSFIQPRNVSAIQTSQDIAEKYIRISLSNFSGLKAPSLVDAYRLAFTLESSGTELARSEIAFSVCEDKDGDGACVELDCNDTNQNIRPGAPELCNGMDDNCDGQIDEAFFQAGMTLGSSCGLGECSVNKFVCSADKKSAICGTIVSPRQEICANSKDDDCDGVIDEEYESGPSGIVAACTKVECTDGDTSKPCGSNIGICREGHRECVNGQWNMNLCVGKISGTDDVCNGKDDDCDGIVDNVDGGSSAEEAQCGCYGGEASSEEICDGMDNDCNGKTDEIGGCCTSGQTRTCGQTKGICRQGKQMCINGDWSMECIGGIRPNPEGEICYNGLDDNCNGQSDERCSTAITCSNGIQDQNEEGTDCGGDCPAGCGIPYGWLLFAGGIILLIVAVALLELKGVI